MAFCMDSTISTIYTLSTLPKVLAFQLCHRLNHTHKHQKIQSFFLLILLSVFSLYFLTSNSVNFIWVFAFFAFIIISLTLAFHSQIHVSMNKTTQNSTTHNVVWSIGCDHHQKHEKVEKSGSLVKGFVNGDIYEGEMHKGKCNGKGVYHYYMCGKYEGDWVNGKYEGYGEEIWLRGSKYGGEYRNGLRHGFGVYKFFSGDVYGGEWFNGHCHGCGVHGSIDGSKYVGEFKWGLKHGFGHYHYRNGDVYGGEYFADKMHGFGVYKFGNGQKYEGSWHQGKRQGFGVYTFRNGEVQSGYWQNGILDHNALPRTGPSSSSVQPYSSQIYDVVQKAREASQRSYNVVIADEHITNAIAEANRSASAARMAAINSCSKEDE